VPLERLAKTETFLPLKVSSSHYYTTPDPSNPMMGKFYFLMPYKPV